MAIETERSRRSKAPKGRSSGSIFRNPSLENPAGKILDQLAAKNLSAGSFSVSSEHANWIVNHGSGPAPNREQDIVLLIRQLMDMAQEKAGIQLHPEVKFMNPETQSKIKKYL